MIDRGTVDLSAESPPEKKLKHEASKSEAASINHVRITLK